VLRKGKSIYNFAEFMRISMLPVPSLRRAIQRLLKKRLLLKLSKELYANPLAAPSLEEVASVLYPPSYISLESALFMHGILEQAPHLLTCVSKNKTKTFRTDLGEIAYFHLKRELFFGYDITDRVPLAWPEKAALDFVYIQRQNGLKPSLDEWNWENLNVDKMNSLAKSYPETVKTHIKEFLPSQS
jgi:predicted transcriptional regulator of viral defense system